MSNYLTRKKALMGAKYEIEVPVSQYDAVVRIHAIPDMELARIEARVGYKLEDAIAALSNQNLTEAEIKAIQENKAKADVIQKGAKALSPQLTLFLGELCKAGIVPDPACKCKGKGCEECDVSAMVEELMGFSVLQIGMATIAASTASWKDVEDFFSRQKEPSGAGSSA
jgi:hypothetical protein